MQAVRAFGRMVQACFAKAEFHGLKCILERLKDFVAAAKGVTVAAGLDAGKARLLAFDVCFCFAHAPLRSFDPTFP